MTKASDRRARLALERATLKVKEERLTLIDERRFLRRERADAITYLRLLCERYGDNDWTEDTSLLAILEDHLATPLGSRLEKLLERLAALQQTARTVDQRPAVAVVEAPSDPAAEAVPCRLEERRVITESGRPGYQQCCACGWSTTVCPSQIEARLSGDRHLAPPVPPAASRPPPPTRRRYA